MGETFQGIKGNFQGYALENLKEGNPDPELDTTNFDSFFGDGEEFNEIVEEKPVKKKAKKKKRKQVFIKSTPVFNKNKGVFGGF